jgi:hypothetical protein
MRLIPLEQQEYWIKEVPSAVIYTDNIPQEDRVFTSIVAYVSGGGRLYGGELAVNLYRELRANSITLEIAQKVLAALICDEKVGILNFTTIEYLVDESPITLLAIGQGSYCASCWSKPYTSLAVMEMKARPYGCYLCGDIVVPEEYRNHV